MSAVQPLLVHPVLAPYRVASTVPATAGCWLLPGLQPPPSALEHLQQQSPSVLLPHLGHQLWDCCCFCHHQVTTQHIRHFHH